MSEHPQAMVHFTMDGELYGFNMPATSFEDAERRLAAVRMTGKVVGWPCYSYRTNALTLPFVTVWVVAVTFFRNFFRVKPKP
jgi:hypothetical protein